MADQIVTDRCEISCVHTESVIKVRQVMPLDEHLLGLTDLFKVLGDFTRIRILHALQTSELCVCDLVSALNMNQSAVSHQLRVLRQSKLVKYRKDGKNVYYRLNDGHVQKLIREGLDHVRE